MRIRSQLASVLYKLVIFLTAAAGVLSVCGVFAHRPDVSQLWDYAVFSGSLCALFYFVSVLYGLFSNREFFPRLRGALLILLFVSVSMDAASLSGLRGTEFSYVLLHQILPAMVLLDWLLFGEKDRFRWTSPLLWLILPDLYFAGLILRAVLFSGGWQYAFLNYDLVGVKHCALTLLLLNFFALAMGYLLVSIDRLTAGKKKKRKKK